MVLTAVGGGTAGCSHDREGAERSPVAMVVPEITVAVAPALNFSGSRDFDPASVADLMASELTGRWGVGVIGVNRVLAVLAEQGVDQIQSPQHALDICERLGADAVVVFAITEYDPYTPVVGIAAQLYGKQRPGSALDPVATSRMARPFPVASERDAARPLAQVQVVFNGAHESVQRDVYDYAGSRGADDSPLGERKYLVSQELYLRYCCHRVSESLIEPRVLVDMVPQATATPLPRAAEESRS